MSTSKILVCDHLCKDRYKRKFENGEIDVVDEQQNIIIYPEYSNIEYFMGVFIVDKNGLRGIYNLEGKQILPCIFESIFLFDGKHSKRYLIVKCKGKYGLFDIINEKISIECGAQNIKPRFIKYKDKYEAVVVFSRKIFGFIPWFPKYQSIQLQK